MRKTSVTRSTLTARLSQDSRQPKKREKSGIFDIFNVISHEKIRSSEDEDEEFCKFLMQKILN